MKSAAARASTLLIVALAGVILVAIAWLLIVYPTSSSMHPVEETIFDVGPRTTLESLSVDLEHAGFIPNARVFAMVARLRLTVARGHLRQRKVCLRGRFTPLELLQRLATGVGRAEGWVNFPEGTTRFDIARKLEHYNVCSAQSFLEATVDRELLAKNGIEGPSAEGFLFPSSYLFFIDSDPREVVERMIAAWKVRMESLEQDHATEIARLRATGTWSRHDIMVLASIVEKETAVPEERPIIAGVFLNRLRSLTFLPRARLQADPTVTYGCLSDPNGSGPCAAFDGRAITRAMLEDSQNPYNTYRISGMPPTPIANPGLASIRAVLEPAEHDFYYFVATGGGRHTFTRTLDEHHSAVHSGGL